MRMKMPESGILRLGASNFPNQSADSFRGLSTFLNPCVELRRIKPNFIVSLRVIRPDPLEKSPVPGTTGIRHNYPINRLLSSAMTCQADTDRQSALLNFRQLIFPCFRLRTEAGTSRPSYHLVSGLFSSFFGPVQTVSGPD